MLLNGTQQSTYVLQTNFGTGAHSWKIKRLNTNY